MYIIWGQIGALVFCQWRTTDFTSAGIWWLPGNNGIIYMFLVLRVFSGYLPTGRAGPLVVLATLWATRCYMSRWQGGSGAGAKSPNERAREPPP